MKMLPIMLLALATLISFSPGLIPQEASAVHAQSIDQRVVYTDAENQQVATVTVTAVDNDYEGVEEPEPGFSHRAVSIDLENISERVFTFMPARFQLVDSFGSFHYREYVRIGDAEIEPYLQSLDLQPGESESLMLIFMVPTEAETAAIYWQPESTSVVVLDLLDDTVPPGSVVRGIGSSAHAFDESGNGSAIVRVDSIVEGWSDYDEYSEPAEGNTYWAVHLTITNTGSRSRTVDADSFYLISEDGFWSRGNGLIGTRSGEPILDREILLGGETKEQVVIVEMPAGSTPVVLQWGLPPDDLIFIFLPEGDEPDQADTSVVEEVGTDRRHTGMSWRMEPLADTLR